MGSHTRSKRLRAYLLAAGLLLALGPTVPGCPESVRAEGAAREVQLDEAIELALVHSPDLASAEHRLAAARAAVRSAEAALYPRLGVSQSYAATNSPVQSFMMKLNQRSFRIDTDFNDPPTTDNLNTRLSATYSLFRGGSDVADRAAALLGAEAQQYRLDAARSDLAVEVTRAYYAVMEARRFAAVAEASVVSMEANLHLAESRMQEGAALRSDVLDARVGLADARESLVRARSEVAIGETMFRTVLGVDDTSGVVVATAVVPAVAFPVAAPESLHTNADENAAGSHERTTEEDVSERAEWIAASKTLERAEQRLRAAEGDRLPRVDAFADYDLDSGDASDFEDSWMAGVRVELDVFDGFRARGEVAELHAQVLAAREELRKTELLLRAQVRTAHVRVEEAVARLATTASSVEQAEQSLAIIKERYRQGLALVNQLLDAEVALRSAHRRRIAAEADYVIARAEVGRAMGRPWNEWMN